MLWVFKTSLKFALPVTGFVSILLPFSYTIPHTREVLQVWIIWLPFTIFCATFAATCLVLLLYWYKTGKTELPKSDYEKLKVGLDTIDRKINKKIDKRFDELKFEVELLKSKLYTKKGKEDKKANNKSENG